MSLSAWSKPEDVPSRPAIRATVVAGVVLAATFFIGLGGWAAVAPLSSAAIAPGEVRVESHRKTVQHLEGGIVRELLVRDGDRVSAGQILLQLDDTQTAATLQILQSQHDELRALEARLLAERQATVELLFPSDLAARRTEAAVASALEGQERLFRQRRQQLRQQLDIIDQQIGQLEAQIQGAEAQLSALDQQLALARSEVELFAGLVEEGLAPKPRLLAVQGQVASLEGSRGEQLGRIAEAEQAIAEARLRAAELQSQSSSEVESQLFETQAKLAEVEGKLEAASDQNSRMLVTAPVDGQVVNLRVHTMGGVVEPGQALLDIVPEDDTLVIDARVQPADIDVVHAGLAAQVALTAYKRGLVPLLDGEVVSLSADAIRNEEDDSVYYAASISIAKDQLARLENVQLYPGMPVEVLILTGRRTALDYALGPLAQSFHWAFREE
ncbi:MAG TPA: HlyD family type I secretion periplasmic adaptor subunit [Kiloniellales bacterium]|nr:HlyD family type I secretion periplasmic adaptor subunit [Kiloniellales bacterium]